MKMMSSKHLFASFVTLILNIALVCVAGQGNLSCVPCIDRPYYRIKAIVHGTSDDRFWQRTRASSIQAGKDMRIDLDFDLYDVFDPVRMAADIEAAATDEFPPDALIVTIPTSDLESAIKKATEYIPVFGMNSGYDLAKKFGVMDFIAMNEELGGRAAAEEFLKQNKTITKALYINHGKGNTALDQRFNGFRDGLGLKNESADELVVDLSLPGSEMFESIVSALKGCEYEAILLAGGDSTLNKTLSALDFLECPRSNYSLGAFDEGVSYAAIATGKLLFTISQQSHLQATLSVVAAATYATTGKKLSTPQTDFGTLLSGPDIITLSNLPSDSIQQCEEEGFPVCQHPLATDGVTSSSCDCLDRSKIKIAGVLHGITTDGFWDVVFSQARQAADDLGIKLELDRLEPQPTSEILHEKMAQQIISLCSEGVDGIFISVPSELVHPAIQQCRSLNIPVISVNAGASYAEEQDIVHHISQLEFQAGKKAGAMMAEEGVLAGICLIHEADNAALAERCDGFEEGMKSVSPNITYLGNLVVPFDSKLVFIDTVEKEVEERVEKVIEIVGNWGIEGDWEIGGDWNGIGALSMGSSTLEALISIKGRHSELVVGTFDTSDEIFNYLDAGTLLFGIDQNPFMQGYMPVWLLTIIAHTKQHLLSQNIETGPIFVKDAPSNDLQDCTANHFEVCPRPEPPPNLNQLTAIRPFGLTMGGISMLLSVLAMIWIGCNKESGVVRKSQPLFLGMICVGTFLMAATIIPLSIDDSIASEKACTAACMASPWFFCIGFIIVFSALFSKIDRIKKLIESSSNFRRVTITVWDVMRPFCILLTLTLIFLLVWTVVDPMFWTRKLVDETTDDRSSFGSCGIGRTNVSRVMFACLVALAFACVIMACIAAWSARKVSIEYSESRYVTMIVVGMLQAFPLGIPLTFLTYSNPTAQYFVLVAIVFLLTMSILLLIFIPKIHFYIQEKRNPELVRASASRSVYRQSLCVTGRSTIVDFLHRSPQQVGNSQPVPTTEVINEITKTQLEDLRHMLVGIGTIDDTTDLRSIVGSVGIIVSDAGLSRSISDTMTTDMTDIQHNISSAMATAMLELDDSSEDE